MIRLLRLLHRLYPASFRVDYGREMEAILAAELRNAATPREWLALYMSAVVDVLSNAVRIHWDILRQDLRCALRTFSRSPGFALTVTLIACLGIGATTAAFSIADHVLIRPLPFADSERLVTVWESPPGYSRMEPSPPNYRDWKTMSTSFDAMAAHRGLSVNLVDDDGTPERLEGAAVTADLLPMLGVQPAIGRLFAPPDDEDGAAPTLLLGYGFWRARFGSDPLVLGRKVLLDDVPHTIIGVMPASFHFPRRAVEIWTAMRFAAPDFEDRDNNYLHVLGRLKPGVSLHEARAEMTLIAARLERAYPNENARTGITVNRLRDEVPGQTRTAVLALVGAAACMLLIACANLANLLLARALAREHELALRTVLGAGRERLWRQVLTENAVLTAAGGAAGVILAMWTLPVAAHLTPHALPIAGTPQIDLRVLLCAALLTAVTTLGCSILPVFGLGRGAARSGLQATARVGTRPGAARLRAALVTIEVTAAVVLLISAGLLIRALDRVRDVDPGFRAEQVLTLRTSLPMPRYGETERRTQFYDRVLTEIQALPDVSHAAYISFLPMVLRGGIWPVSIDGRPARREEHQVASLRFVTPGFFAALGVPLRLGRDVASSDTASTLPVAVVSESFVRQLLPDGDPLGRRFQFAFQERTIVGVVGDVRVRGLERPSEPQVYLPSQQVSDGALVGYAPKDLVIRSSSPPEVLMPAVRHIIARADPHQPISDVRMLSEIVEGETAARGVQARVVGAFAAVAALLAAVGIHGLLAFTVSSRTREIGVRLALGAQRREILAMIAGRGARWAALGTLSGVVIAYGAGRYLESLLADVSPADPLVFGTAAGLSLAMTAIGCFVPAWRAAHVDPVVALRAE